MCITINIVYKNYVGEQNIVVNPEFITRYAANNSRIQNVSNIIILTLTMGITEMMVKMTHKIRLTEMNALCSLQGESVPDPM